MPRFAFGPSAPATAGVLALLACGLALLPATVSAQAPYEPNDSPATATGPLLAGGTYSAMIETGNDRDLFYFYIAVPERQVLLDITNTSPASAAVIDVSAGLYDAHLDPDRPLDYRCSLDEGENGQLSQTLGPGVYYVGIEVGCLLGAPTARYTFTISGDLADAATMRARCDAATNRARAARRRLGRAERTLRHARRRGHARAVTRAKRQVRAARKNRRQARRSERLYCVAGIAAAPASSRSR
jgi:hypothetical protein